MLRTSENETEILLGNKQLLGIFFAVAALLGVAFYGGYAVGKGAAAKKATPTVVAPPSDAAVTPPASGTGGETHSVPASDTTSTATLPDTTPQATEPPLGSPKRKSVEPPPPSSAAESFTPHAGQTFVQVTAVGRDEAFAIADVLQKKGFRAHAVPKPGSSKLYRVLVGPVHDAADLSSTRDSLRRTGFREVIVQRY